MLKLLPDPSSSLTNTRIKCSELAEVVFDVQYVAIAAVLLMTLVNQIHLNSLKDCRGDNRRQCCLLCSRFKFLPAISI